MHPFSELNPHPAIFLLENQRNNPVDKVQGTFLKHVLGVYSWSSKWPAESETNKNSVITHVIRRMRIFYNHLKNPASTIILDSLELSMQQNKDDKASCFTSILKIAKTLDTPVDQLADWKILLIKKLNEGLEQLWHHKRALYIQGRFKENLNSILVIRIIRNMSGYN